MTTATPLTMTPAKYASEGGVKCPNCGSYILDGGNFEIDAGIVWRTARCATCESEWNDTYTLTGYDSLQTPADLAKAKGE